MIGISPGTRTIGLAVIKDTILVDWTVKKFQEEWSDKKFERIIQNLEAYILRYNISVIAIKRHHVSRTSKELEQLVHGIMLMAKRHNINCKGYTIEELEHLCNGASTKEELMSYIYQHYPEIIKNIKLTKDNIDYHLKMVEAVALVHVLN